MRKSQMRYYRTIFLGVAAMGMLIWSAMDQFDISRQEMLSLFIATVLTILAVILSAAIMAGVWIGIRKLLRRTESD